MNNHVGKKLTCAYLQKSFQSTYWKNITFKKVGYYLEPFIKKSIDLLKKVKNELQQIIEKNNKAYIALKTKEKIYGKRKFFN